MLKVFNRTASVFSTVAALAAYALILSCSSQAQTNPCPPGADPYTKYTLYFGRGDGDNPRLVSDSQWEEFLEDSLMLTPGFPPGFTVLDAEGGGSTLVREATKVLIILVKQPDADSAAGIDRIIEEYGTRFGQGVLREVENTCASFPAAL